MSATPSLRRGLRIVLFLAGAHFLLTALLWGLALVTPRDAPGFIATGLLALVAILLAPLAVLAPLARDVGPAFIFPPGAIFPVAFASVVWAVVLYGIFLLLRRFVRDRPSVRAQRFGRRFALVFAAVAITWLFFGPVFGFAGDTMFGVLDPARIMDGRFRVRPVWLAVSVLGWAASIFGSYRFLIIAPSTRELTPTA